MLNYNYKENQKSCTKIFFDIGIFYRFTYTSVSPEFSSLIAAKANFTKHNNTQYDDIIKKFRAALSVGLMENLCIRTTSVDFIKHTVIGNPLTIIYRL